MIEIAISSMQEALAANGDEAPAGSWDPVREPIPDVGELARDMEARLAAEEAAEADTDSDGVPAPGNTSIEGEAAPADPGADVPEHSTSRTEGAPVEGA
jgi:hypothetical protein